MLSALWVFSDEVTNAEARETLVNRSADSGVDRLYQSVYRSSSNSDGWRMYEALDIAALITLAHGNGIEVWAAYGAPDWASDAHDFALDRMREVNAYNDSYHTSKFDGVTLDVEPGTSELPGLLTLYQDVRDTLNSDIKLAAAIRFFWDMAVDFPPGSGNEKPAYEHIIDMDLDNVVVMGYRDSAAGIISLDQDEVAYADSLGKEDLILAGVETGNCAPGCGPEFITFFEEGQVALNTESDTVSEHFAESISFGGFAIHRYGAAYLSGNYPEWPPYNITMQPSQGADLTGDGYVSFDDLAVLLSHWNEEDASFAVGNIVPSEANTINFDDLAVLLAEWTGPAPAASPQAAVRSNRLQPVEEDRINPVTTSEPAGDVYFDRLGRRDRRQRRDDTPLRRLQSVAVDRAMGEDATDEHSRRRRAVGRRRRA